MIGAIFLFIGAVLNLVLFFKVWGMCNNVSRITEMMYNHLYADKAKEESSMPSNFKVGDKVVILSSGKVTTVVGVNGDKIECKSEYGESYGGVFESSELNKF